MVSMFLSQTCGYIDVVSTDAIAIRKKTHQLAHWKEVFAWYRMKSPSTSTSCLVHDHVWGSYYASFTCLCTNQVTSHFAQQDSIRVANLASNFYPFSCFLKKIQRFLGKKYATVSWITPLLNLYFNRSISWSALTFSPFVTRILLFAFWIDIQALCVGSIQDPWCLFVFLILFVTYKYFFCPCLSRHCIVITITTSCQHA